jgi:hypothetical protein
MFPRQRAACLSLSLTFYFHIFPLSLNISTPRLAHGIVLPSSQVPSEKFVVTFSLILPPYCHKAERSLSSASQHQATPQTFLLKALTLLSPTFYV